MSFEEREAMRHSACRIRRHQYEIDVPLCTLVPAISPQIAEGHRVVRDRLPRHALKEVVKEIGQRRYAFGILRRFFGVGAIGTPGSGTEAVTVVRQAFLDVESDTNHRSEKTER